MCIFMSKILLLLIMMIIPTVVVAKDKPTGETQYEMELDHWSQNLLVKELVNKGVLTPEEAAPFFKKVPPQHFDKNRDGWLGKDVGRNVDMEAFGWIDAGVAIGTNLGNANSTGSYFVSSPQRTSRIGLQGRSSLENGIKMGFYVAQGITPGDGTGGTSAATGSTNALFGLGAYGWLSRDDWGKITLGRQDNITYPVLIAMDARGGLNFGGSLSFWVDNSMFGGTSTSKSGLFSLSAGNQSNNTVVYEFPTWKGVTLQGQYSLGGVAGNHDANSKTALAVYYRGIPGLTLATGQININNSSGTTVGRTTLLGGNYKWDDFTVATGYVLWENPAADGANFSKYHSTMYSGKYQVTPKLDFTGGVYFLSDDINEANKATQLSLVANYSLSKSNGWVVDVYAGVAQMQNKGNMGLMPMAVGQMNHGSLGSTYKDSVISVTGQTQDAAMIGMMIRF